MGKEAIVKSSFKPELCGGYGSPMNPQFSFRVSKMDKYNITVQVTLKKETGLIFWVNENNNPGGSRLLSLTSSENKEVCKSGYLISNTVSVENVFHPDTLYTITPCLQTPNQAGTVEVVVRGPEVDSLVEVKPNVVATLSSTWKENLDGGYKSLQNPQFELTYTGKNPTNFMINLSRKDRAGDKGIFFFVLKSVSAGKRRKIFAEEDVLFESKYYLSSKIDGLLKLTGPATVIIIACLQQKVYTSLELSVESPEDFKLKELTEVASNSKREFTCADILKNYKGSSDGGRNKIVYYDTDPVEEIIKYCTENEGKFVDPYFPPNDASVNWDDGRKKKELAYDAWLRVADFMDSPEVFVDGISLEDMCQGYVGNCWYCQGVASITKRPELVKRLITPSTYSQAGVYSVKLYIQGDWRYVIIDDYIPTKGGSPQFATSKNPNEIWPMLLEKAFAKTFSSYRALASRDPAVALKRLTGGATEHIPVNEQFQKDHGLSLWKQLKTYTQFGWIMGLVTKNSLNETSSGMVAYHAYSLLKCAEVESKGRKVKLVQVRNTWGRGEWKGAWSDSDKERWTEGLKRELEFENKDDGVFWMDYETDLRQYFQSIYLCKLFEDSLPHAVTFSGKWSPSGGGYKQTSNPYVVIEATNPKTKCLVTFYRTGPENLSCGLIGLVCHCNTPAYSWYQDKIDILAETSYYISDQVSVEVELNGQNPNNVYRLVPCLEKASVSGATWKIVVNSDHPIRQTQ